LVIALLVDLALKNAKIALGKGLIEGGIAVEDGKICAVAKTVNLPKASTVIDVRGNVVFPGFIDAHVHLRDLELAYKEDFYTGTCAAVAGGFTTVLDMPNTRPPTDSVARLREKVAVARSKVIANTGFFAGLPPKMEEVEGLGNEGAFGLKIYPSQCTGEVDFEDDGSLLKAFKTIGQAGLIVAVHAESPSIIASNERRLRASGEDSLRVRLEAHPPEAEIDAVGRVCRIAEGGSVGVHLCHVSLAESLFLVREAKRKGVRVTCEATPHHLFLTEDFCVGRGGGVGVVNPPLRGSGDAAGLWDGVVGGLVDVVASDHAPHGLEEKRVDDVWRIAPGFPGLETTLPLLLTRVNEGGLSLVRLVEVLAGRPAAIFNIRGKGRLEVGCDADLTVVDMKARFRIDASKFYSKAKYSPFDGWEVVGKPVKVFVDGKLAMDDGEVVARPGSGRVLRAQYS